MFQYEFMVRAFITGLIIAVITPCIGAVVVFKRFSMIGDTLSHTSLAGVSAGLVAGINPVAGAAALCIFSAFGIEAVRKFFPKYAEIALAVILSAGAGLAGVLSGFVKSAANFNSFLFGSIVAVSDFELAMVIAAGAVVLTSFLLLYKALFYMVFDEESARLAGVPVRRVNFIFTLLVALTVSVAVRTIGALIVSSLMVLPVACAMQVSRSYAQTTAFSMLYAVSFIVIGLTLSFYLGLKPGGVIALTGTVLLVLTILARKCYTVLGRRKIQKNPEF